MLASAGILVCAAIGALLLIDRAAEEQSPDRAAEEQTHDSTAQGAASSEQAA